MVQPIIRLIAVTLPQGGKGKQGRLPKPKGWDVQSSVQRPQREFSPLGGLGGITRSREEGASGFSSPPPPRPALFLFLGVGLILFQTPASVFGWNFRRVQTQSQRFYFLSRRRPKRKASTPRPWVKMKIFLSPREVCGHRAWFLNLKAGPWPNFGKRTPHPPPPNISMFLSFHLGRRIILIVDENVYKEDMRSECKKLHVS